MKVVQILPELNAGGVERGTLEVARFLVEQGHEAVVVSNGGRLVAELEESGARHVTMPVHRKSPLSLLQIPRLRRRLREEAPDILHARSRVPAWIAWLAWKGMPESSRPRFVTTVHGAHSVNVYSAIMTKGERVIAVSDFIRSYIVENYSKTPSGNIRVIHRGVDPEEFLRGYSAPSEWSEQWYRTFPVLQGRRLLTLVGRMTRLKGHEMFFRMIAKLASEFDDIAGLVVGGGDEREGYASEMHALVDRLGIADRVVFAGHRADVREIYSVSALTFSLSTKCESFGRTVLEPLAMGIPSVGYDRGGVGEILRALFSDGAVPPDNLDALVDRVGRMLREGPGEIRANDRFLLSRMLGDTLQLYEELSACG